MSKGFNIGGFGQILNAILKFLGLGGGGGILPVPPTTEDIEACCKNLSGTDGAVLRILFKYFSEIVTDGIHNGQTCPILVYAPAQNKWKAGEMTDKEWAAFNLKFFKAKYKQNLNGKKDKCKAALKAAGLPVPD